MIRTDTILTTDITIDSAIVGMTAMVYVNGSAYVSLFLFIIYIYNKVHVMLFIYNISKKLFFIRVYFY